MRRWLAAAASAAQLVSERPMLWIPGALASTLTVGWIPLVVAVARPPTALDLTFVGEGFFSAAAWPWNAVGLGIGIVAALLGALALASLAESTLLTMLQARPLRGRAALRAIGVTIVAAGPAFVALLALATAAAIVARSEFVSPQLDPSPIARTLARIAPLIVLSLAVALLGAAWHAASIRLALRPRATVGGSLLRGLRSLAAGGAAAVVQVVVAFAIRIGLLVLAAMLLSVLWAPIGARLGVDSLDAGLVALLVGFVAIWLCLVLAGGAVHAWGTTTWSFVLDEPVRAVEQRRI